MLDEREGTVTGPGGSLRLEPRVMAVLTELAKQRGRVVSRQELHDTIWPDVVVTDYTLNRCIYRLRRALDRVAGNGAGSEHIETLPKRGYRLLADVSNASAQNAPVPMAPMALPATIPYVVGQWVRGDRFYGRSAQIAEVLRGERDLIWLLGTRRVGKTSLLKQIELVSGRDPEPQYFAIYWDFQGVDSAAELHLNFTDALLDVEERLQRIGINVDEITADDLFVALERLRRRLHSQGLRLLLLCDEVEELLGLQRADPSLLRKLRHALQSRHGIRTVLASTISLWALAGQTDDTSPFLHGFTPPIYIDRLTDDEARSLVRQSHLRPEVRPDIDDETMAEILEHCDNHPYLVQLVCKRFVETGQLDEAVTQVATDRMVSYFFSVDFDMLNATEQRIVRTIAETPALAREPIMECTSISADELDGCLRQLINLGFIRHEGDDRFALANYFFQRWLRGMDAGAAANDVQPDVAAAPQRRGLMVELKRRKVFRVAIAYVVVAWLLLQIGDIVFDFLEVPNWAGKLLLALLVLGLPVALVLSWAYELTSQGIRREQRLDDGGD
ncbi:MAG: winged helix-turn-helix domain-containing protein [Gammaproteobacteria bacterium]|nr:winged helix-turn-helix domain-containing protein [Gammaproteobacteria bacterium]